MSDLTRHHGTRDLGWPQLDGTSWLEEVVQGSPVPTLVIGRDHGVRHWNRALETVSGVPAAAVLGSQGAWRAFYPTERAVLAELIIDGSLHGDIPLEVAGRSCRPSPVLPGAWEAEDYFPHFPGGGRWLVFTAAPLTGPDGTLIGAIETLRDITGQRQAQHLANDIIEGCPVPMMVVDADHRVTHWNRAAVQVIGVPAERMIGSTDQWQAFYDTPRPILADLVIDGDGGTGVERLYQGRACRSKLIAGAWQAVDHFPHFANGGRWLAFTAAPLRHPDGAIAGAVETLQDITAQKTYEQELQHQATHDRLTGLANRALLADRLEQALIHAENEELSLSLVVVDLDHFKVVNDTLGHGIGDMLVAAVARRIAGVVGTGDTVARVDGDEFVVLLYAPPSEQHVADVAEAILREVRRPYDLEGETVHAACSIGIACHPRDGTDAVSLMKHAELAMYRAKDLGRSTFSYFAPEMNRAMGERLALERDLTHAMERGELELYFQPQVRLADGHVDGAEALLRWNHPTRGLLGPDTFIRLAEETGLIIPIGRWVMEAAVAEARRWQALTPTPLSVAVNLSSRQFGKTGLFDDVALLLADLDGGLVNLELEITESMVMQSPEEAAAMLTQLKAMGARLAMDDFGTGYSSLAYLSHFPFDIIKIDKSFVSGLGRGRGAEAIVGAIVALASSFGHGIIAEGVETPAQRDFLRTAGCGTAQGYLFGRPMPAPAFRQHLVAAARRASSPGV